jgi:hypothetical protein
MQPSLSKSTRILLDLSVVVAFFFPPFDIIVLSQLLKSILIRIKDND